MKEEAREASRAVEESIHDLLSPLGFKKQKLNWRRRLEEVHQQLSIVSMQLSDRYQPRWGLNLISLCEDPRPLPWKLQVSWYFADTVQDPKPRENYYHAFNFGYQMAEQRRRTLSAEFVSRYVIPCFQAFETKDSVRIMMKTLKYPLRAHQFYNMPDEWWPK